MKKLLLLLAIPVALSITGCNENNEVIETQETPENTMEQEDYTQGSETQKTYDYCHTCGSEITGSPYEAFGRKYCDMGCYADDPMNW